MKLIELKANKDSFKTVTFNPTGVTLITGAKKNSDKKSTYNGVGKSLIIELIHFCLGASPVKSFELLEDWEFFLKFEINGEKYIASRKTSEEGQGEIYLNGENLSIKKFNNILGEKLFDFDNKVKNVTVRTLLPRLVRRGKSAYLSYKSIRKGETDFQQLINLSYLLGLDTNRVEYKQSLKKELDNITSMKNSAEKDPYLKEILANDEKIEINIKDLEDKIKELDINLKNFKIAEDYREIKEEVELLSKSLKSINNQVALENNKVSNIEKTLSIKSDIKQDDVLKVYKEAQITLPESVLKNLDDLRIFHGNLLQNRIKRLTQQKSQIEKNIRELISKRQDKESSYNEKVKYLSSFGALDEYVALNEKLSSLKTKLNRLKTYEDLLEGYKNKQTEIKQNFLTENINTTKYLKEIEELKDLNMEAFRSISREFYQDKAGGIEVQNNDGENQERYRIDVSIKDDSSDGINEVKIFCFDFTILQLHHNHKVNFAFHDSRLFSNMDPRQKSILFQVAHKRAKESSLQYIATLNQNDLNDIKAEMNNEELYKEVILDNIVLELTDESDSSKLLGQSIELKYEKD